MQLTYRQQVMVVTMVMMIFVLGLVVLGARLVAENIVAQRDINATPSPTTSETVAPDSEVDIRAEVELLVAPAFDNFRVASATENVTVFVGLTQDLTASTATALDVMRGIADIEGVTVVTFVLTTSEGEPYEALLSPEQQDEGFTVSGNQVSLRT